MADQTYDAFWVFMHHKQQPYDPLHGQVLFSCGEDNNSFLKTSLACQGVPFSVSRRPTDPLGTALGMSVKVYDKVGE